MRIRLIVDATAIDGRQLTDIHAAVAHVLFEAGVDPLNINVSDPDTGHSYTSPAPTGAVKRNTQPEAVKDAKSDAASAPHPNAPKAKPAE